MWHDKIFGGEVAESFQQVGWQNFFEDGVA